MSILTIADLRAHSRCEPMGCWHWLGAKTTDGSPRIWTYDHDRGEKTVLSGPRAVWNIAHGAPLRGRLAYRACFVTDCVSPLHIRAAASRDEMYTAMRLSGARKGRNTEACRANIAKARQAQGITQTPDEIVMAIRSAPAAVTGVALAARYALSPQTVSKIRRGESRREVA